MPSFIPFDMFDSAAKVGWDAEFHDNLSLVWSLEVKFSTYGQHKVITFVKMKIVLISACLDLIQSNLSKVKCIFTVLKKALLSKCKKYDSF